MTNNLQFTTKKKMARRVAGYSKGFTLIESLVGVTVLLTAIVGPLTIASRGVSSGTISRDQILAYNLAQEALEAAHNQRDRNALTDPTDPEWLRGLVGPGSEIICEGENGCLVEDIQRSSIQFEECNDECAVIRQHTSGLYGYGNGSSWTDTKFRRTMRITTPVGGNPDEAQVVVTVSWPQGSIARNIVLREALFRWRQ